MTFLGLSVHTLISNFVTIVMFIGNLSINDGLCNGTRIKIIGLLKFNMKVAIITGTQASNCVDIPGIFQELENLLLDPSFCIEGSYSFLCHLQ